MEEDLGLADLTFDFEDYFERHQRGELSEAEAEEFDARVIGIFCRRMLTTASATGTWNDWENFAAYMLAKKLQWVIGGVEWRKQFHLPMEGLTRESDFTRTGERAAEIFCAINNALKVDPSLKVVDLIAAQADRHCVSFESARADYYRAKMSVDAGAGFRPFLKRDE